MSGFLKGKWSQPTTSFQGAQSSLFFWVAPTDDYGITSFYTFPNDRTNMFLFAPLESQKCNFKDDHLTKSTFNRNV